MLTFKREHGDKKCGTLVVMSITHRLPTSHRRLPRPPVNPHGSLRLILRPHAFLNQLLHFNHPQLIVRTAGLSICRETEFGVFFREENPALPIFTDPVSGLTVDAREVSEIYLFQPAKGPATFEIRFSNDGFAIAIQPDQSNHSRTVTERITTSFIGESVDTAELNSQGAGAWLDEWKHTSGHGLIFKNQSQPNQFTAQAAGAGFSLSFDGEITADYPDNGIHRISVEGTETVIFAREHCFTKL